MEMQGQESEVRFYDGRIIRTRAIAFLRIFKWFKIPADWWVRRNVRIPGLCRAWYSTWWHHKNGHSGCTEYFHWRSSKCRSSIHWLREPSWTGSSLERKKLLWAVKKMHIDTILYPCLQAASGCPSKSFSAAAVFLRPPNNRQPWACDQRNIFCYVAAIHKACIAWLRFLSSLEPPWCKLPYSPSFTFL